MKDVKEFLKDLWYLIKYRKKYYFHWYCFSSVIWKYKKKRTTYTQRLSHYADDTGPTGSFPTQPAYETIKHLGPKTWMERMLGRVGKLLT